MKIANIITAAASTALLGIALAAAPAHAASPSPATVRPLLTELVDISYEGGGDYMDSCGVGGDIVYFQWVPTGCNYVEWDAQIQSNGDYYWHPHGEDSLCLTVDTSNGTELKIEGCVAATNQYFSNPDSSVYYNLISIWNNANVDDPGAIEAPSSQATLVKGHIDTYGSNGWTMRQ